MNTRTPPEDSRFAEADRLARDGRLADALAWLEAAVPAQPSDPMAAEAALALARLARPAEAAHELTLALRALDGASRLRPRWPDLHYRRGRLHGLLKQRREARRAFERALELNSRYVDARLELALLDAAEGRVGEALEALRALGRDTPVGEPAEFERGLDCLERAEWEQAGERFARALRDPRTGLEPQLEECRAQLERGEAEAAAGVLRELARAHAHYPDVHFLLGCAEFRLARPDDALDSLARALELNPDFHLARIEFARTLDGLGQRVQATEQVQLVLQHAPEHAAAIELYDLWTRRGRGVTKGS